MTDNEWQIRNRNYIREVKNKPCTDCKRKYPYYVMDFDHLPGSDKVMNLSEMARSSLVTLEFIKNELAKCEVVCSNCHREREFNRKVKHDKTI